MKQEKEKKKGKIIGIIVGIVAFVLSYYGVQQLFKTDLESDLENTASEFNKQMPIQIDQSSRLDSVSAKGKTNFIYYYTLMNAEKLEVNLDTVNKYIRHNIIKNVKDSPELKIFRDNNITFDYKYYDRNGSFAMEISVTPEIYKTE